MKKLFFTFFTLLLCISMSNELSAQAGDLEQSCGRNKEFTRTYSSPQCFSKKDYPEKADAENQLFDDIDGDTGFVCKADSCATPTGYTCSVRFKRITKGKLVDRGSEWCTASNEVSIKWGCTNCKRVAPADTEEKPSDEEPPREEEGAEEEKAHEGHATPAFSTSNIQQSNNHFGYIERIAPNPSNGLFKINVLNEYEGGQLDLVATDLMGKVLRQKSYENISASNFNSQIDLSDFQAGIYLLSVRINGQLIGTSKVIVQN